MNRRLNSMKGFEIFGRFNGHNHKNYGITVFRLIWIALRMRAGDELAIRKTI